MPAIIERSHLFSHLQADNLPRLIAISAAPGYGKTVLARQIANWYGYPAIWQAIDIWQRDLPTLHETSLRVWSQHVPNLIDLSHSDKSSAWEKAKLLVSKLGDHLENPCLYIIDDVHHLADSSDAEQWLQMQIDDLPDNIHIMLVGRYLPHLSWTRLVGRGLVTNFDTEQLRFTAAETQSLFQISEQKALELVISLEGWIAGIRLALNPQVSVMPQLGQKDRLPEETLFNQMADMAFLQQAPDRQHFLLTTATLSTISAEICRELFGIENIFAHVEALLKQNLFIFQTSDNYRYHDLFRQYLQKRLEKQDPKRYQDLHLQAAQWYEAQNHIEKAILHFVKAERFTEAIRLAEWVAKEFHVTGRWENLLHFQHLLSEHDIPLLQLYCAIILIDRNQLTEAEALLILAEHSFLQRGEKQSVIRVYLQLAFSYNRQGLYQQAITQAQKVLELVDVPEILRAWARRVIAWSHLELGNPAQSIIELDKVLPIYSNHENSYGRSHILQDMSSVYLRSGDFKKAGTLMQEVLALRRDLGNPHDIALALNNLGYYYHCNSQYQEGLETLKKGLQLIPNMQGRTVGGLYWSSADIYRDLGQYRVAENHYLSALKIAAQGKDTLHSRILLSFARMRIWQGRLDDAQILLAESLRLLETRQGILAQVIQVMQLLIKILRGDTFSDSSTIISRIDKLNTGQATIKLVQLLGFYLYVGWQQNETEIIDHAQHLITELPAHLHQALAAEILNLPRLLEVSQKVGLSKITSLSQTISILQQEHTTPMLVAETQSSKMIELFTLGRDTIRRDGQILAPSAWTITLARELFYYLYFNGSQSKETIALTFWPEHDNKQVRTAFHDTLKRLRGAIPDGIVFDGKLYQVNPNLHISCDVEDFYDLVHRARHLPTRDARTEDLYLRALTLYQGDFLPTIFSNWIQPQRDELENLYIKALLGLAECAQTRQAFDTASAYYQQAIEIDPYNETIYCLQMRCSALAGHLSYVKQIFDKLNQRLADDLAVSPAPETQQLFYNLLA